MKTYIVHHEEDECDCDYIKIEAPSAKKAAELWCEQDPDTVCDREASVIVYDVEKNVKTQWDCEAVPMVFRAKLMGKIND